MARTMEEFQRLEQHDVYRNQWLCVQTHAIIHPNGTPGEHVLIVPQAASGVVVEDDGDLLFARQPRFAARREVVEIVKGGAHGDEDALACAQRELREELGIVAVHWRPLGSVREVPSIIEGAITLFWATGIEHVPDDPESVERISLVRLPAQRALRAALHGELDDAVTLAALLRYGVASGRLKLAASEPTAESRSDSTDPPAH